MRLKDFVCDCKSFSHYQPIQYENDKKSNTHARNLYALLILISPEHLIRLLIYMSA